MPGPQTIDALYRALSRELEDAGIESASLDARLIISHHTGLAWADIVAHPDKPVEPGHLKAIEKDARSRMAGVPLSRLRGRREFWGLDFMLSDETLDPRPDTETLIQAVIDAYKDQAPPKTILDMGTGTGCILITLLTLFPEAKGTGLDLSAQALETAQGNAVHHDVAGRTQFVQGRWTHDFGHTFDLVVSNPPYIARAEIENLSPEVKNHDPILALDGGKDGLEAYKIIFTEMKKLLKPSGRAFFEIGFDQRECVMRLAEESGLSGGHVHRDFGGYERVLEFSSGDK